MKKESDKKIKDNAVEQQYRKTNCLGRLRLIVFGIKNTEKQSLI